jgi:hypothetical protein
MPCQNCESENPDSKRFCGDCGAALLTAAEVPTSSAAVSAALPSRLEEMILPKELRQDIDNLIEEQLGVALPPRWNLCPDLPGPELRQPESYASHCR